MKLVPILVFALFPAACALPQSTERPRARDVGVKIGKLSVGPRNAITDVPGVSVGHATVRHGNQICTGVTVVLPHAGNLYREKVPAAIEVGNGYGKLVGITQVNELGQLESPIALTNTLSVGRVMDAMVGYMLELAGNESVGSVNVVVGETNDGRLNDIRGRHVAAKHLRAAIAAAKDPASSKRPAEGAVGAGTGTVCFGFKGGIGTSSRRVGKYTVGVLVQSNFGGDLTIAGKRVREHLRPKKGEKPGEKPSEDGSCMIVIATDAPLTNAALHRLAKRSFVGMARTGASFSNGSGDYAIAFSTAEELRIRPGAKTTGAATIATGRMTPLFRAVADATEEAILNSLFRATTTTTEKGRVHALPIDKVKAMLR